MPNCVDFEVRQNVHFTGPFTIMQDDNVTPFDLTDYALTMTLRHGGTTSVMSTADSKITVVDAATGKIEFNVLDSVLGALPSATYIHQLVAEKPSIKSEFWHGTLKILPGVTV